MGAFFSFSLILYSVSVLGFPVTPQADHGDKYKLACTTQCIIILFGFKMYRKYDNLITKEIGTNEMAVT